MILTVRTLSIAVAVLLLITPVEPSAVAGEVEKQICDVSADYFLGVEDYEEAIAFHNMVLRKKPNDALAHYHLGFAEGMIGNTTIEIAEYQRAEALGVKNWDLFVNLGLAQLENDELEAATNNLQKAVLYGGQHAEAHFNLALVEERRGLLADAEHEALASLVLSLGQPDARNLLGVIYAEEGKTDVASQTWLQLVKDFPDYKAARTNLLILGNSSDDAAFGKTADSIATRQHLRSRKTLHSWKEDQNR